MMTCGALKGPYNMSHFMIKQKKNQKHCLMVGQKHYPKLVKKTILVVLDLLKSTCPRKPKWFLTPCHFGVLFGLKIQFEKRGILVMDVRERIDPHFPIKEFISKSRFLDFDEKEVENVNKRGWRINKHVEFWAKNVFDEWRVFHGLDTTRSIVDLSKD